MADEAPVNIEDFFKLQQESDGNNACCDTGSAAPHWASVSHGIYISIESAGIHRSLGVRTSFVLSLTLDHWKPEQLRMMELGGNQRFQNFMTEQGVPDDVPIREKYSTRAAAWYRLHLQALAEDSLPPEPLPYGTGHLPFQSHPDPTLAVLDRVFASVQCGRHLREDEILAAFAIRSRAEALRRKERCPTLNVPKWMCEQLQYVLDQMLQVSDVAEQESLHLQDQTAHIDSEVDAEDTSCRYSVAPLVNNLESAENQQQSTAVQ
jgi:ADP-ribosylation factor GTPase-activating protein 1